jgi:uncharacterized protein YdeI (BOF family)
MSTNLFSTKSIAIILFVILILSNLAWAGALYYTTNSKNDKALLSQNQEKLNQLDVNLPSSKYNSYNLQNPETAQKIKKDLDKAQRVTVSVKKSLKSFNTKSLSSQSEANLEEFRTKQSEFESNKKQVDCILRGYENSGNGNNLIPYGSPTEMDSTANKIGEILTDAVKCGLVLKDGQKDLIVSSYKAMVIANKEFSQNQQTFGSKYEYRQPTAEEQAIQQKAYEAQSQINTNFGEALMTPIRDKYEPLVDYIEYLKVVSF